jgi:hypothetical protein
MRQHPAQAQILKFRKAGIGGGADGNDEQPGGYIARIPSSQRRCHTGKTTLRSWRGLNNEFPIHLALSIV